MKVLRSTTIVIGIIALALCFACKSQQVKNDKEQAQQTEQDVTAKDILGNPEYLAISYGGYRQKTRDIQPTLKELKEDLKILQAMNIKLLRTYNVQLPHAHNVLQAIWELKQEDPGFEMYVMLGAWIDCANAWTDQAPDHNIESEKNSGEIARAVSLANQYPDIVKIIAVGNEAMVKWAASYFVQPDVILKWVNHLQELKMSGELPKDLWVTSSDDYASWGGGDSGYHVKGLEELIRSVDYISMHTYPYHNTHYNPKLWGIHGSEEDLSDMEKVEAAMDRAIQFAKTQYDSVATYMKSLGVNKPIHIGETGWATVSNGHYGPNGSKATDELKEALYYQKMRKWTNESGISCFYFEALDEPWKEAQNDNGSENHFGLFTVDGQAKYALWDFVDEGIFNGLTRNGNPITKSYDGLMDELLKDVELPATKEELTVQY